MTLEWMGYMAAACTTLSFVPQAAKTIRTVSRFRLVEAAGDIVEVNSAQLLYAYKRGVHTPFVADLNHRIRFTDGVPTLERKVVRLINSTDSLSALGFLL